MANELTFEFESYEKTDGCLVFCNQLSCGRIKRSSRNNRFIFIGGSYYTASQLREIADKLDELNNEQTNGK